jgi:hypothetical protein
VRWLWSRFNQTMRLEMRYDDDTSEFVVVVEDPSGRQESQRFADIDALRERLVALDRQCEAERWTPSASQAIAAAINRIRVR